MDALLRDLRYALRSLRRAPGFAAVAALTLALGIGVNTMIFSVVDAVLLRPLPYDEPSQLVRIFETAPQPPNDTRSIAHPTLDAWRELRTFESIALYGPWSLDLVAEGRAEQLLGATVSAGFFTTFRVQPVLGRAFTGDEHRPGGPRAIVLGDALWRQRFAADGGVIGRTITLDGQPFTVVGVMPRGFGYPTDAGYWVTTAVDAEFEARRARHLSAIGRLRPGVTAAEAAAELLAVEHRLAELFPEAYKGFGIRVIPLHERMVGTVRSALLLLLSAVGAVLLIACANVANLTLTRAAGRRREFAVRTALGADGKRVARLLIIENLVIAVAGGAAGILVASLTLDIIRALGAGQVPRIGEVALDARVLAFSSLVTIGTGLLVALVPLLNVLGSDLQAQLKEGGKGQTFAGGQTRLRGALVIGQTAMALVLLTAAGLLIKSFARLAAVDPGVRTAGVLSFHIGLPPAREDDGKYIVDFYRQLRERLETIPGVTGAGQASRLPLSGEDHSNSFRLLGDPAEAGRERSAQDRAVSPGYFRTLGIRVRGREFSDADGPNAAPVAMVNEAFARRFFPGRDAVGEFFVPSRAGSVARQIVGVAGDARQFGLHVPAEPEFYLPHAQDPWPWLSVVVRTSGAPRTLLRAVEEAVWSLDRSLPVTNVRTMDELLASSVASRRLGLVLIGAFAAIALALAAIGTYGVMAYIAAERRPEMGIRLAVGARPLDVVRLLVVRGLRLGGVGLALGIVGAMATGRAMRGMLYDVGAFDAATVATVAGVLGAAVLLASYLPARRAAAVDPVRVLRGE